MQAISGDVNAIRGKVDGEIYKGMQWISASLVGHVFPSTMQSARL